jgi:hypothetical protein
MKRRNRMTDELSQVFWLRVKRLRLMDAEGPRSVLGLAGEVEGGHCGMGCSSVTSVE